MVVPVLIVALVTMMVAIPLRTRYDTLLERVTHPVSVTAFIVDVAISNGVRFTQICSSRSAKQTH